MSRRVSVRNRGKQDRSRETFEVVLAATIRILEKGKESLTTNSVAHAAGISVGTLYQYFPNKESIMAEVIKRELEKDLALFREKFDGQKPTSLDAAVDKIVETALEINQRHAGVKKAMFEYLALSQQVEHIKRIHFENVRLVADYVSSARGWDEKLDPSFFALMTLSVAASVFQLMTEYGGVSQKEIGKELRRLLNGYLALR